MSLTLFLGFRSHWSITGDGVEGVRGRFMVAGDSRDEDPTIWPVGPGVNRDANCAGASFGVWGGMKALGVSAKNEETAGL